MDEYDGSDEAMRLLVENNGLLVPMAGGRNVVPGLAGAVPSTVRTAADWTQVVCAELLQPVVLITLMMDEFAGAAYGSVCVVAL